MKKITVILIFSILLFQAYSETLLVYTRNNVEAEEDFPAAVLKAQAAVEDGIMSVLFDDGHIVFNAGVVKDEEDLDIVSDRVSVRVAKNGGASWLVEVDLYYTQSGDEKQFTKAEYSLYDLNKDEQLISEQVSVQDVRTRDDQKLDELCQLLGEGIGFHVARWLPDESIANLTN